MARPPEIVVGPEVHYRFRHDSDFGLGVSIEVLVASFPGGEGADEIARSGISRCDGGPQAANAVLVIQIFDVTQNIVVGQNRQAESAMGATARDLLVQQALHDAMVRAVPFAVGVLAAGSP